MRKFNVRAIVWECGDLDPATLGLPTECSVYCEEEQHVLHLVANIYGWPIRSAEVS